MGFLQRMFKTEKRAGVNLSDPGMVEFLNLHRGGAIDPDRVGGLATGQACVALMSQTVASLPLRIFRGQGQGGRTEAKDHPLYEVLQGQFNDQVNAFEGREYLVASLMTHGNAYARIEWNNRGQAVALHLLHPSQVTPERLANGRVRYRVQSETGGVLDLSVEEILHLRNRLGRDGLRGISPIEQARETFMTGMAQQGAAQKQAQKGFRPEGALVFPAPIGNTARADLLENLRQKIARNDETSSVHILDGGVEWKPFSFSSKDSEFLASRGMTDELICRIFGVPPTAVGILTHGTYSNVEQESRALVIRCLAPMAARLERAMNAALLPGLSRQAMFIEHDLAGLLRGDMQGRFEAYRVGRNWGWLSANEIRRWENLPEIEGGDEYLTPLNMVPQGERVVE